MATMILVLDFDGVLHPFLARSGPDAFCYISRLEVVLREFPAVRIVITSTQRESLPFVLLVQRFSPDIAARIVGITPVHGLRNAGDVAGVRHREILAYIGDRDTDWLALNDDELLFPLGCPQLVLCEDGFRNAEERFLRVAFERMCGLTR